MTPERVAALARWWVRFSTRELPRAIARRRVQEVDADLDEHIAHGRARGTGDARIALGIASRLLRGPAADAAWRGTRTTPEEALGIHGTAAPSTIAVLLAPVLVLLVPLAAMQITDAVAWGPVDFALAGTLLVGTGLLRAVAARRATTPAYEVAVGVALATALLLVWSSLAVGVVGEEGDPADLRYGGVLAVALVGAAAARLRPRGMARALLATALAQALVAATVLVAGEHEAPTSSALEVVGVHGLFVALFLGSAWLFRHAARTNVP